jgi:hypothetical protein
VRLDEFESVFRSAVKPTFTFAPPPLARVLLVTHVDDPASHAVAPAVERLLAALDGPASLELVTAGLADWKTPQGRLALVESQAPDLIVTWRNLAGTPDTLDWDLGPVVHALTQGSGVPVLLLPDPHRPDFDARVGTPTRTLIVTDHLTGDDRLANWGVALTPQHGHLHLAHIEDRAVFEHYMDAISRLPEINTDQARELLLAKLLSLPEAYCASLTAELAEHHVDERIVSLVALGDPIGDYPGLVEQHRIDLLICNTQDPGQRAMDALAHALAVELHDLPLLLL